MEFEEARSIVEEARYLSRRGDTDAGERILRSAAHLGSIDAMVELARWARDAGRTSESEEWMQAAESALRPEDVDGHISLNGAYSLGLGHGDPDELEERALYHLEQVALAGNTHAQERLALQYLAGKNGAEQSVEKFVHWIKLAIAGDSPRAVYIYADYLFRAGRPVPADLLSTLHDAGSQNKAAAKLATAIERRQNKAM